jgi:hypothetical protein
MTSSAIDVGEKCPRDLIHERLRPREGHEAVARTV